MAILSCHRPAAHQLEPTYTPETAAASGFLRDPTATEGWCYTDQLSYTAGELLRIHASATTLTVRLAILRDGPEPVLVHETGELAASHHRPAPRCFEAGCGWPVAHELRVPASWSSGVHRAHHCTAWGLTVGGAASVRRHLSGDGGSRAGSASAGPCDKYLVMMRLTSVHQL